MLKNFLIDFVKFMKQVKQDLISMYNKREILWNG